MLQEIGPVENATKCKKKRLTEHHYSLSVQKGQLREENFQRGPEPCGFQDMGCHAADLHATDTGQQH